MGGASAVGPDAGESGALVSACGNDGCLLPNEGSPFTRPLFCSRWTLSALDELSVLGSAYFVLGLISEMLISSRNTLIVTRRNYVSPTIWASLGSITLTHKIDHHRGGPLSGVLQSPWQGERAAVKCTFPGPIWMAKNPNSGRWALAQAVLSSTIAGAEIPSLRV